MSVIPATGIVLFLVFIISLCIGSFLNVVIDRLPKMIEEQAKKDACEILSLPIDQQKKDNLLRPSSCAYCHKKLRFWQNIPLLSFILLRGKCFYCKGKISFQHPMVELISALGATLIIWQFNFSAISMSLCILYFYLITLFVIDLKHYLLPDALTLSLLWLGLIINTSSIKFPLANSIGSAIAGAILGYLLPWVIYWLFKIIRKKEGLGYGDFKLLSAIGAWVGVYMLPLILLVSALIGIFISLILMYTQKENYQYIPFGTAIAIAVTFYIFFSTYFLAALYLPFFTLFYYFLHN
ncbi:prepilin peptidase [Fangia hongkongensis]|uniref:prepilin peptidase n=1 Tax=Fangia hongkongensis TaxID=270495 RepID=UPI00036A46D2|nr:A24 family peptidase [Fangia hongkongensis]MBK2125798.1 prepilin peptidase [Fangia hongkongensis]